VERFKGIIEFHPSAEGDVVKIEDRVLASSREEAKLIFEKTWYRNAKIVQIIQVDGED
jgi:hypothetical protein